MVIKLWRLHVQRNDFFFLRHFVSKAAFVQVGNMSFPDHLSH